MNQQSTAKSTDLRKVNERWWNQYFPFTGISADKEEVYIKLSVLDRESASPKDISGVIGNDSWTRMSCDECKREVDWLIQVGEKRDYESRTACLCKQCVAKVCAAIHA